MEIVAPGLALTLAALAVARAPEPRAAAVAADPVAVWVTTADEKSLLERGPDLSFARLDDRAGETVIDVDETTVYQEVDGFGASLTESSASVLANGLSEPARDEVMRRLFSRDGGIGLSLLRQPMSASDFALGNYTYDDRLPGDPDPELRSFSIDRDRPLLLPLLKRALEINPGLRFMATPWSAPAWMKTSRSLYGGRLEPAYYPAYASLFVRFVLAYAAEGLKVDFVTVQNEPHFEPPTYPGMRMDAPEQAAFIRDHLGPALRAKGLDTRILVWDHNWDEPEYALAVLADAGVRRYAAGTAFHCYAGEVERQLEVHRAHPDLGIWFTECSGGDFAPRFADNLKWNVGHLMIGAMRHQARSVLFWNLALDEHHGPRNGGCADCRGVVTVNTDQKTVRYEVEYYALGHLSAFVVPGARRIESTTLAGLLETVAFRNPDGSKVLLALNASEGARPFQLRQAGRAFSYTLPPGAVATFRWP